MAESGVALTPDAVAKILNAKFSTTHRIFNSNKSNLVEMRLVEIRTSKKWRNTGTTAKWYSLSLEGILTYLDYSNERFEFLTPDQIHHAMRNFATFYSDYPIFKYWSQIHDSFEDSDDRVKLYFTLRVEAMFTLRKNQGSSDRVLVGEFQLSFFNSLITAPFWPIIKNGIIKEALTEVIKDYADLLDNKKLAIERIKAAYGV